MKKYEELNRNDDFYFIRLNRKTVNSIYKNGKIPISKTKIVDIKRIPNGYMVDTQQFGLMEFPLKEFFENDSDIVFDESGMDGIIIGTSEEGVKNRCEEFLNS